MYTTCRLRLKVAERMQNWVLTPCVCPCLDRALSDIRSAVTCITKEGRAYPREGGRTTGTDMLLYHNNEYSSSAVNLMTFSACFSVSESRFSFNAVLQATLYCSMFFPVEIFKLKNCAAYVDP
jgi:hypothetical protein